MNYRIQLFAAGAISVAVSLAGCFDSKSSKDEKVGIDEAKTASLPAKLTKKLSGEKPAEPVKKAEGKDSVGANYIMGPLDSQLQQLKAQAETDRQALSKTKEQAEEFKRRTQETQESLKRTEMKIANIQKVIGMINEDPNALDRNKELYSKAAELAKVPDLNEAGPLSDGMPTLAQTSPLTGGPGVSPASPDSSLQRNGMNLETKTPAQFSPAAAAPKSLSPLAAPTPGDGPELNEKNGVWTEKSVPIAQPDGKILLCDGSGAAMQFMINLGKKDGISEGMLFEATGANSEKNVLVVTKVYQANAEAKLHPRFASGGLKDGAGLHKLAALPE